jgi:PAS domain S-box-containing protein
MDGSGLNNTRSGSGKALADLATEALIVVDRGCITYSNPAAQRLFAGTAASEPLEGKSLAALCDPCPASPQPKPIPVLGRLLDGRTTRLEAWPQPGETDQEVLLRLREQAGASEAAVAAARDLRQQERLERLLSGLDVSDDAIFLIDRGTMRYLDVNEGACRLLGYPREELMRRTANQTSRTLGTVDELGAVYDDVIAHAPATQISEVLIDRADGTTITCEVRRKPLWQSGRWIIAATLRDITERKRTQARMNRFATALDLSGDAVFLIDRASMEYVDVNEAACTLLGYARDDLLRRKPHEAPLHRYAKEQLAAEYDLVIAQAPATLTRELEFVRRDGSVVVCEVRRQAIQSDTGWMIVANCRDMTERRTAQSRVQLLASAVNSSADRIYFVDRERMEFIEANAAALKHQGAETLEELKRLKPWEAIRRAITRAELESLYDRVIAQAPHHYRTMDVQRDPNGVIVGAAEITRTALNIEGRWIIVATWHDMSDHLRQRARVELFATALDLSADGVFLVDRQSMRLLDVNQTVCDLLATTREELFKRPLNLFSAELSTLEDMAAAYDQAIAQSPVPHVSELSMRRADGSVVPCEVRRQAMRSADRWVIVATARDITERKKAQARMELFASSLNMSADGIFFIDRASMTYVDVNDAACRLVGLTRNELLARRPGEFASRSLAEITATYDDLIARAPATSTSEGRYRRADGSLFHAEVRRQAILSDGRWLINVNMRDISERKTAQARNELLATAMNSSPDRIYFVDRAQMELIDANEAAFKYHGVTNHEDLRTRKPWEWTYRPTTREELVGAFDQVIACAPAEQRVLDAVRDANGDVTAAAEVVRRALRIDGRWVVVSMRRDITEQMRQHSRIERLATALNFSPDGVSIIDRESMRFLDVNQTICTMLGMERDEYLKQSPNRWHANGKTLEELAVDYDRLIAQTPMPTADEIVFRRVDGSELPCEVRRQAVHKDGRWLIIATVRDITERKAAQARNELLATAMNSSADHLLIIDPQTTRIIDANEAALKFHGLRREEALAIDVWSPIPNYTREQMAAEYRRAVDKWPDTDRSVYLSRGVKSGRTGIFDVRRQALRVGDRWVVLATATDVTERQEHLARIERLAAAMDFGEDGVLLIDAESRQVVYANEATARLLRKPREELVGSHDEAAAQLGPSVDDVIRESPATLAAEIGIPTADGGSIPCEIRRQAIRSQDRWIIVSTLRDISERRRAEEEIRRKVAELTRSNQELEQFAYVTSHDLSEPLRMVASYTQLLERRYSASFDADAREFMGYIVGGAQRMKQLIDDLLMYSRAGRPNVQMREFRLDQSLDDALANLAHAIEVSGAKIEREPLPTIVGDKSGMVQVFQNLIGNAIKFRAENTQPVVRVSLQDAGAEWVVSVSDNGIGIAPEYFRRIFVIFQRLHPRQKYEGTGIGLAICKKVIDRHGGRIDVESRLGAGTAFSIRLPKSPTQQ